MASKFLTTAMVSMVAFWGAPAMAQNAGPPPLARKDARSVAIFESLKEPSNEFDGAPGERSVAAEGSEEGGASLGQVAWVLVIQAGRGPKGDLVPWDKESTWSKAWRVPGDAAGTRYVPVLGDAEDLRQVKPTDPRHLGGLSFLATKYQAPAIAVVVRERDAVAVVGWRNGATSRWTSVSMPESAAIDDAKAAAIRLMAEIFPSRRVRDPEVAAAERLKAKVLAFRDAGEATRQYQIVVEGKASAQALQSKIESVKGLSISEIMTTSDGYDIVVNDRSGADEPVERRLTQAGLPTSADGPR